jgi:photosystem II stability/assembly factor-like uncharacterized protein
MSLRAAFRLSLLLALALAACRPTPAPTAAVPVAPTAPPTASAPPTAPPAPTETPPATLQLPLLTGFYNFERLPGDRAGQFGRGFEKSGPPTATLSLGLAESDADRGLLVAAYQLVANQAPTGNAWTPAGPAPITGVYMPQGRVPGSGRVNGIAVDPRDSDVVYAAVAAGGVWKTTDAGQTWRSLTDREAPAFYSTVLLDPHDPDRVYAPLGVFDGYEAKQYGYLASGILRSDDGGATWTLVGQHTFNAAAVSALVFGDDGELYAASGQSGVWSAPYDQSAYGVYKSTDRGDTWKALVTCADVANCEPPPDWGLFSEQGGFMDLDRASDGTLYASVCEYGCYGMRLLRSRDDGINWDALNFDKVLSAWERTYKLKLSRLDNGAPYLEGLEVAVAPGDPDVLLAGGGLYFDDRGNQTPWSYAMRSTDGGDTWQWLPEAGEYCTAQGSSSQCTYDNVVEIDPHDPQVMYLAGSFNSEEKTYAWINMLRRSTDGGDTWSDLTPGQSQATTVHPDIHCLAFDPQNADILWMGGDGGVDRTANAQDTPPKWTPLSQGMNTMLIVDVGLHPSDADYMLVGLQDNANAFTTDGGQSWEGASQGDAGYSVVDPFKPNIVYSYYPEYTFSRNSKGGVGGWDKWTGSRGDGYTKGLDPTDRWLFYPPLIADPHNEGVLYFASNRVYKTENRGDLWKKASNFLTRRGSVRTLALAPSDSQVLYAGTTDGLIWVTTDGGGKWSEITGNGMPKRVVNRIAVDPTDSQVAYVVFGGFEHDTVEKGHVFETTDGGTTWKNITGNLPDAPLNGVVIDVRADYAGVYVGGAAGVWVRRANASSWQLFGTGLPYVIVTDLELNPETGILAAATWGRSVWVMRLR